MEYRCCLCGGKKLNTIYRSKNLPIFQNKSYDTTGMANASTSGNLSLLMCKNCGFIFNCDFDSSLMKYDDTYHNEQDISSVFSKHMDSVVDIFECNGFLGKQIVEIGCGKGQFVERLQNRGFKVMGFDPAYEGNNPNIIKDYFSEKYSDIKSDLVIMRHVLEHIENPLGFLRTIAKSCKNRGSIYIEIPDFDWILDNGTFWDLCYEHCNYFTAKSLDNIFHRSKQGSLFGGQYMYILADLEDIKKKVGSRPMWGDCNGSIFMENIKRYTDFVRRHKDLILWGAGTKGVLVANLTDPNRKYISCLIDINPKKQNKFIPLTGHPVYSPDILAELHQNECGNIMVMNDNYMEETRSIIGNKNFILHSSRI